MSKETRNCDFLNRLFNKDVILPDIGYVTLDRGNIDQINPDIVTVDNVWSVLVMTSMVTKNSGLHKLYKLDVERIKPSGYSGEEVLKAVMDCVSTKSGNPDESPVEFLTRGYVTTF